MAMGTRRLESSSLCLEKREECSSGGTWSLLRGVNLPDFARPGESTGKAESRFFIRLMPISVDEVHNYNWMRVLEMMWTGGGALDLRGASLLTGAYTVPRVCADWR